MTRYSRGVSRVRFAAGILEPFKPRSLLDIGCRDAELASFFPEAEYSGADLFPGDRVIYVGDIATLNIERRFDTVVACDILEHLDDPSGTFDRLAPLAERRFLISLPNCYDLKKRWAFARGGPLGGKYVFTEERPLDRHHWLMNRKEIYAFARAKAEKHGFSLKLFDMTYGSSGNRTTTGRIGRLLSAFLPKSLSTETVFALFSR
jgi:hypothetical protein